MDSAIRVAADVCAVACATGYPADELERFAYGVARDALVKLVSVLDAKERGHVLHEKRAA